MALDDSTIFNNYNTPLSVTPGLINAGLVGLWNFEDTTSNTVKDATGGSTPGIFVNGADFSLDSGFYSPSPTPTYEWFINGGSLVLGTSPFYFADSSGNYTVEVSNDNCNSLSAPFPSENLIQNPSNRLAGGPNNICFGDNVLLTATGQTAL